MGQTTTEVLGSGIYVREGDVPLATQPGGPGIGLDETLIVSLGQTAIVPVGAGWVPLQIMDDYLISQNGSEGGDYVPAVLAPSGGQPRLDESYDSVPGGSYAGILIELASYGKAIPTLVVIVMALITGAVLANNTTQKPRNYEAPPKLATSVRVSPTEVARPTIAINAPPATPLPTAVVGDAYCYPWLYGVPLSQIATILGYGTGRSAIGPGEIKKIEQQAPKVEGETVLVCAKREQ